MRSETSSEWNTAKLKELVTFRGGGAFSRDLQGQSDGDYPVIKVSDMARSGNEREICFAANWIDEADTAALKMKPMPLLRALSSPKSERG